MPFSQSFDDSSTEATILAIAEAIKNNPVLGAAQVIAGIYGGYSSYEMGQALDRIEQLGTKIEQEMEQLKIEIEQLKINEIVSSAQASVASLRDIDSLSESIRNNLIVTASTNLAARVDEASADVSQSVSFVHPYFLCVSLRIEVLKRKKQYISPASTELRDAINSGIQRGNEHISQLESFQISRVGPAQYNVREQRDHSGEVIGVFYTYFYTLDGQAVNIYTDDENPPSSAMEDTQTARQRKIDELLQDLAHPRSAIQLWTQLANR